MSGGKATGLSDEDDGTKVSRGSGADNNKNLSDLLRKSLKRAKECVEELHSHLEDLVPSVSAASGSAAGDDLHGSEEEPAQQRPAKEMRRAGPDLEAQLQELLASSEKQQQQLASSSAAEEDLNDTSDDSSSPEPPLSHPPYPKSGSTLEVLEWKLQCDKIDAAANAGYLLYSLLLDSLFLITIPPQCTDVDEGFSILEHCSFHASCGNMRVSP